MKKNTTKVVIFTVVALLVGYVLGLLIQFPDFNKGMLGGDIEKASKYNQKSANADIMAMEEKLQSDTAYLRQVVSSLLFVNERINAFSTLVDMTADVCRDEESLHQVSMLMPTLQTLSGNAQRSCGDALAAVVKLSQGETVDFESAMNNATLSYTLMNRANRSAKSIVSAMDQAVKQQGKRTTEVSYVRDNWAHYCATEALLQGDQVALDYWVSMKPLLSASEVEKLAYDSPELVRLNEPLTGYLFELLKSDERVSMVQGMIDNKYKRIEQTATEQLSFLFGNYIKITDKEIISLLADQENVQTLDIFKVITMRLVRSQQLEDAMLILDGETLGIREKAFKDC